MAVGSRRRRTELDSESLAVVVPEGLHHDHGSPPGPTGKTATYPRNGSRPIPPGTGASAGRA